MMTALLYLIGISAGNMIKGEILYESTLTIQRDEYYIIEGIWRSDRSIRINHTIAGNGTVNLFIVDEIGKQNFINYAEDHNVPFDYYFKQMNIKTGLVYYRFPIESQTKWYLIIRPYVDDSNKAHSLEQIEIFIQISSN